MATPAHQIPNDVFVWVRSSCNSFAVSLNNQMQQGRKFSPKQIEVAQRLLTAEKAPSPVYKPEKAVAVDLLMQAFETATKNGMKRPRLRFSRFQASLAPASGRNPGAVYLKDGDEYLGKIVKGELFPTKNCKEDHLAAIRAAMTNPLEAAVQYARETGICSVCGRTLTDMVSIANGIGPVCKEKIGF